MDIQGKWGPGADDVSNDVAGLSFVDQSNKTNNVYNGECQWLFRTVGPQHHIIKLLKCRAVDDKGDVLKQLAGGVLERDLLVGRAVSINFTIAKKESPAIDGNWIEFPAGWKRCLGKDFSDRDAYCGENRKEFKSFIMPDGRDCNVYPNCIE
ncbi:hypothetical protein QN391_19825 [Pseudomonas sp. CCI1.2]|uniref:hypothetical protein n=1 Tax=Pseudomonas sp. CCI1.2 TaxID=3048614 RepID=UPI002B2333C7|nr:hypothetical protein [Pseudomonas sp. CCI1.2]MEB0122917.1 hypothetical protein [Pseudomonas sp. CCI1.2]